jgi:hypothetical protein
VSDSPLTEHTPHAVNDVVGGHPRGFVDDQYAIHEELEILLTGNFVM